MPVSVNITLEVVNADVNPTNPDLKLHIRFNGMQGVAYIDWETFIGGGEDARRALEGRGPSLTPWGTYHRCRRYGNCR